MLSGKIYLRNFVAVLFQYFRELTWKTETFLTMGIFDNGDRENARHSSILLSPRFRHDRMFT